MSPARTRGKTAKPAPVTDRLRKLEGRLDELMDRVKGMQQDLWTLAHPSEAAEASDEGEEGTDATGSA